MRKEKLGFELPGDKREVADLKRHGATKADFALNEQPFYAAPRVIHALGSPNPDEDPDDPLTRLMLLVFGPGQIVKPTAGSFGKGGSPDGSDGQHPALFVRLTVPVAKQLIEELERVVEGRPLVQEDTQQT